MPPFIKQSRSGLWPMVRSSSALSTVANASPESPACCGFLQAIQLSPNHSRIYAPKSGPEALPEHTLQLTCESKLILPTLSTVVHIVDGQHDSRSRQCCMVCFPVQTIAQTCCSPC